MRRETECSMQKSDFELAPGFEWRRGAVYDFAVPAVPPDRGINPMFDTMLCDDGWIYPPPMAGNQPVQPVLFDFAEVRAWYDAHPDVTCPFVWGE